MSLVFLDTETTGLDPYKHQIWEIAYAVQGVSEIKSCIVRHTLTNAEPIALEIGRYHERSAFGLVDVNAAEAFEDDLLAALQGNTLVCANPHFDASMLLTRWGIGLPDAPWHYRMLDIESYAMPFFEADVPVSMNRIYEGLTAAGYSIPKPDHTAAGDVAALREAYYTLHNYYYDN